MSETTGGGTDVAAQGASAAEAKRLQVPRATHSVYSTAYVEIERRTEAMQRMRHGSEARHDDEPNGARWARQDLVALHHVREDERSIALDAIGRSMDANRGYASLVTKEAPELVHAIAQEKADRAAAMAEFAQREATPPSPSQWLQGGAADDVAKRAVDLAPRNETAAVMRDVNMVEPAPKRERGMDEPEAAMLRAQVKGGVSEQDPERDAKRDAIDRASYAELGRIAAAGNDQSRLSVALDSLVQRLQGDFTDPNGRKPNPPLEERFNVVPRFMGRDYEFRDQPGKVAFEDRLLSLRTDHNSPSAAIAMMDRAAERGWERVRVNGTEEFKRQAWIAAEARGIKAVGYEPTKGDRAAATAERTRLENEQRSRATPAARRDADTKRADAERPAPAQSQGLATPAVLRAFDLAMERQGIAPRQQDALRKELSRQLERMQAGGRTALVKVFDREAPRSHEPVVPVRQAHRAHSERVR